MDNALEFHLFCIKPLISNCIAQNTVGCDYLFMLHVHAFGLQVLMFMSRTCVPEAGLYDMDK